MTRIWVILLVAVSAASIAAPAGSEVTVAPGGRTVLVDKEIAGLRWTIVLHDTTGELSAVVVDPRGGPTRFVSCQEEPRSGDQRSFRCSGAQGACPAEPCPWDDLGTVTVPASFFAVDDGRAPLQRLEALLGTWQFPFGTYHLRTISTDANGQRLLTGVSAPDRNPVVAVEASVTGGSDFELSHAGRGASTECIRYFFGLIDERTAVGGFMFSLRGPSGRCEILGMVHPFEAVKVSP
jgi:hypothetical protein